MYFECQAHTSRMARSSPKPRCGATTEDGTPCRRKVDRVGQHCYQHQGLGTTFRVSPRRSASRSGVPAYPSRATMRPTYGLSVRQPPRPAAPKPRQTPPTPTPRELERKRIEEAAEFCADSLSATWQDAVTDRICDYAGTAWGRLKRSRRKRNCKALARLAAAIMQGHQQIHQLVGRSVGWISGIFGAGDFTRAFAAELTANIPLGPIDAKVIAVARGLQVSGIVLCLMGENDLTKCQCFIDLALSETKERVKQILIAAMSDWTHLARFTPSHSGK